MAIAFGTEGWRAVMADQFTVENVRLVAQAVAEHYLNAAKPPVSVVIGHDTRLLSDRFARAVAEVLAGNGIRTILTEGSVPTCAVSRYVVAHQLSAGVMITASHNPPDYNGIKVKEHFGGSATTETVGSIERRLGQHPPKRLPLEAAVEQGAVTHANLMPDYLKGIRSFINLAAIRKSRLKIVVDPMHGTGDRLIEGLLKGGRCAVQTLHAEPDARFGGHAPEPIAKHLTELIAALKKGRWDIGLATDGDADRIGVIAPDGAFLNPGQIMCILIEHLMQTRKWKGAIVKTVSNTSMLNRLAEAHGLKLMETPVGFKHVAKLMMEDNVLIGGEESGGIGVRGYLPERDGVLNGLLVLEALAMRGEGVLAILRKLEKRFGRWHYARRDLTVSSERIDRVFDALRRQPPSQIAGIGVADVNTLDGVKLIGRDQSWLLFRRSGTEPIVRVYAESPLAKQVPNLLDFGAKLFA